MPKARGKAIGGGKLKPRIVIFILIFSCLGVLTSCASFTSVDALYNDARHFAKEGRQDFAFLSLTELLREDSEYRYAAEAKFAIAEYYFLKSEFSMAIPELVDLLNSYPESKLSLFTKSILYKIISDVKWEKSDKTQALIKEIRNEFFASPVFFVFSEFKEKSITSLLGNTYLLKEYVDKIDIFQNDKLFLSVSP